MSFGWLTVWAFFSGFAGGMVSVGLVAYRLKRSLERSPLGPMLRAAGKPSPGGLASVKAGDGS